MPSRVSFWSTTASGSTPGLSFEDVGRFDLWVTALLDIEVEQVRRVADSVAVADSILRHAIHRFDAKAAAAHPTALDRAGSFQIDVRSARDLL